MMDKKKILALLAAGLATVVGGVVYVDGEPTAVTLSAESQRLVAAGYSEEDAARIDLDAQADKRAVSLSVCGSVVVAAKDAAALGAKLSDLYGEPVTLDGSGYGADPRGPITHAIAGLRLTPAQASAVSSYLGAAWVPACGATELRAVLAKRGLVPVASDE